MKVVLDGAGGRRVYTRPAQLIAADDAAGVPGALGAISAALAAGRHVAGFLAYELGYALEPRLARCMPPGVPLLRLGVFDTVDTVIAAPGGRAYAGPLRLEWDRDAYAVRFARVKALIAAGDIYQANLSLRAHFAFLGDPLALYERLRAASGAGHAGYVDDGARQILSLSPELFFELTAAGRLTARPMKGTAPRRGDDDAARAALAASAKDRAENLMIVDLIRNDLSRIAETGSVKTEKLFTVETYPSLHTMVSTVTAQKQQGAGIRDILRALFPCGSVTGAPKIRAMEVLQELESRPRGPYCGAVGYFAPDGSARFNVAIRTLTIAGSRGELGLGGGVVQDSQSAAEYDECLLKARFFTQGRPPLELIETLKWDGAFQRLERHLARMAASAAALGLAFEGARARGALVAAVAGAGAGPLRVRLALDEAGAHLAQAVPLPPGPALWRYRIAPERVESGDLLQRHKTSWRALYDRPSGEADETLFLNTRGEVAEGARSNVFVARGGLLLTPPVDAGALPGCLRAELLEQGLAREAVLTEADLAGTAFFGNSLRGLIPAAPL